MPCDYVNFALGVSYTSPPALLSRDWHNETKKRGYNQNKKATKLYVLTTFNILHVQTPD